MLHEAAAPRHFVGEGEAERPLLVLAASRPQLIVERVVLGVAILAFVSLHGERTRGERPAKKNLSEWKTTLENKKEETIMDSPLEQCADTAGEGGIGMFWPSLGLLTIVAVGSSMQWRRVGGFVRSLAALTGHTLQERLFGSDPNPNTPARGVNMMPPPTHHKQSSI
jgi:hypothetical protein